jgi:hypothetical protein
MVAGNSLQIIITVTVAKPIMFSGIWNLNNSVTNTYYNTYLFALVSVLIIKIDGGLMATK